MKNFRQRSIFVQVTDVGGKIHRNTDETILKKNPKIDHRLLEEYERFVAASGSGVRLRKQGADYNLQFSAPARTQGHAYRCLSPRPKSARNRAHIHIIGDTALLVGNVYPTKPKAGGRCPPYNNCRVIGAYKGWCAMRTLQSRTPPHELFLLQIHFD